MFFSEDFGLKTLPHHPVDKMNAPAKEWNSEADAPFLTSTGGLRVGAGRLPVDVPVRVTCLETHCAHGGVCLPISSTVRFVSQLHFMHAK